MACTIAEYRIRLCLGAVPPEAVGALRAGAARSRRRGGAILAAKRWTVTIEIDEHDGRTRARARLHTEDCDRLVGVGLARLNPTDQDVPEIGDELAAARALSTSRTTCSTLRAGTSRTRSHVSAVQAPPR